MSPGTSTRSEPENPKPPEGGIDREVKRMAEHLWRSWPVECRMRQKGPRSVCRLSFMAILGLLLAAWMLARAHEPDVKFACLSSLQHGDRPVFRVEIVYEVSGRWHYLCPAIEYLDREGKRFTTLGSPIDLRKAPPLVHEKRVNGWLLNVPLHEDARDFRILVPFRESARAQFGNIVKEVIWMARQRLLPGRTRPLSDQGIPVNSVTGPWMLRDGTPPGSRELLTDESRPFDGG